MGKTDITAGSVTFSPTNAPQYLTIKDCAKILRVSYKTMWETVKSDRGPPYVRPTFTGNGKNKWIRVSYNELIEWIHNSGH